VITLDALARPSGTFLMVAMDQRESLRTMLREHGHDSSDSRVRRFKTAVARELAPHASGFLIDRAEADAVAPFVPHGLILAVDRLVQEEGGIVEDTSLEEIDSVPAGVAALKLLVIWRDDDRRAERVAMARRFVEVARSRGVH
jgi:sulfofructosephosphate aldolase